MAILSLTGSTLLSDSGERQENTRMDKITANPVKAAFRTEAYARFGLMPELVHQILISQVQSVHPKHVDTESSLVDGVNGIPGTNRFGTGKTVACRIQ